MSCLKPSPEIIVAKKDFLHDPYLKYLEELLFRCVIKDEERQHGHSNGETQVLYDADTQEQINDIKQRWERHMKEHYPDELSLMYEFDNAKHG